MSSPSTSTATDGDQRSPEALMAPPQSAARLAVGGAARAFLLLALAVGIFWRGGVSSEAMLAVMGLGFVAWLLSWAVRPRELPRARFAWLWLGLGVYTGLQLLPLPRGLLAVIAPRAVEISDSGRAAAGLAPLDAMPVAVAWGDAALQCALALGCAALALTAAITVQVEDGRRMMRQLGQYIVWLAVASGFLWLVAHESHLARFVPHALREQADLLVFVNPNHQSALLVAGFALALGQVLEVRGDRMQNVFRAAATFLGLAILLVGSRSGILIAFGALGLSGATLPRPDRHMRRDEWERRARIRQRSLLITLTIVVVLVVMTMPVLELEFGVLGAGYLDGDTKVKTVSKVFGMIGDGWLFGQAPGTLPVRFGALFPEFSTRVDFAENIIVQRLFDGGIWGGAPFLALLAWLLGGMVRLKRHFQVYTPMWIAASGLVLANMTDFSLEVGGGLLLFLALVLGAERTWPTRRSSGRRGQLQADARWVLASRLISGLALITAIALLLASMGRLSRDVSAAFAETDATSARARLIADDHLYNHHALYLVARKLITESRHDEALPLLNRALALRPGSEHSRLFRLMILLRHGDTAAATEDLAILVKPWNESSKRALGLCLGSPLAKTLLTEVMIRDPKNSYRIGRQILDAGRPGLVEEVALALRKAYPEQRFNIEGLRGRVYVKRGLFGPARRISAALMSERDTELAGWELEGTILTHTGRHYEGHHLLREVCKRWPSNWSACSGAVEAILAANRPTLALDYIRGQFSSMRVSPAMAAVYWISLARVYLQLGRPDDALAAAERVLGYHRDHRGAQVILVKARVMIGDERGAQALARRLVASDPNDAEALELLASVTHTSALP